MPTGAEVTYKVANNPAVLAATAGFSSIVGFVAGIFGAHHAAAVKNEAAALNSAVPAVQQSFQQTFYLYNSGQATGSQADQAIDATLQGYDTLVYKTDQVKRKSGNGPDIIGKVLQGWADKAKALIDSGTSGSIMIDAIPGNGRGFMGGSAFTLSATPPTTVKGAISDLLGTGISSSGGSSGVGLVWIVLGALFVLWLLSKIL